MKDIMLADTPVEQRAQILRDSCDQIVEQLHTQIRPRRNQRKEGRPR